MKHFQITIWGTKEVEQKIELVIEAPDDATVEELYELDVQRLAELCPYWEDELRGRVILDESRTEVSTAESPSHTNLWFKRGNSGLEIDGIDNWADI